MLDWFSNSNIFSENADNLLKIDRRLEQNVICLPIQKNFAQKPRRFARISQIESRLLIFAQNGQK